MTIEGIPAPRTGMLDRIQKAITNWFYGRGDAMSLQDVEAPAQPREHQLNFLSVNGHDTITWNPDDADSVRQAREKFDELRRRGHSAFRMDMVHENGFFHERKSNQRMDTFDPEAGRIMMVPQQVGG